MSETALVRYDAARAALAEAHRVDEVKDIRDKALAMAAYARQAKDTAMVEWSTEIKVRAERRAGELLRDMPKNSGARGIGTSAIPLSDDTPPTYEELGISLNQASRWQKLAGVDEDKFEAAVEAAKEVAREVTATRVMRLAAEPHVAQNSGDNEWYTPKEYIDAARNVLGHIDLDPASSAEANAVVGAMQFYTEADDGLSKKWSGFVWMNPPYAGDRIGPFCDKLGESYASGRVKGACVLVNNATETRWFQSLAGRASVVCFPMGRVKFWHPRKESAPLQGQAILYLGDSRTRFVETFKQFGLVAVVAR